MDWYTINNRENIARIIELCISRKIKIQIKIEETKSTYTSQILSLSGDSVAKKKILEDVKPHLIIERLSPKHGNKAVQSSEKMVIEFNLGESYFQFNARYMGIDDIYNPQGVMIQFPTSMKLREHRDYNRTALGLPEFVSVEFQLKAGSEDDQTYEMNVLNYSTYGLGLLVTKKDQALIKRLKPGDTIDDLTFYAKWTMIKVDAEVRHITKIDGGEHKGRYLIGLRSNEIIESSRPPRL